MILSGKSIRELGIITPHEDRTVFEGMSFGESLAGYDIRTKQDIEVEFGHPVLGVSLERFKLPDDVIGFTYNKSTLARQHVFTLNTVLEPGWEGYLTLEIHKAQTGPPSLFFGGSPIAQVIFSYVDDHTAGYNGKYQHQPQTPVDARYEK